MRGRQREWLIVGLFLAIMAGLFGYARAQAEEAREAKAEADAAWDSASVLLERWRTTTELLPLQIDSLNRYWRERLDSVAILPPPLPDPDPRLGALLDTAQMTRTLRLAVDAIRQENRSLRLENAELRTTVLDVRALADRAVDSIETFYRLRLEQSQRVILSLEDALAKSQAEADRWESAYYASRMSVWDKLLWAGGGAAVGYLAGRLTGHETTTVTVQPQGYSLQPVVSGPYPTGCHFWKRKGIHVNC